MFTTEKNPHVSGSVLFRPALFRGKQYEARRLLQPPCLKPWGRLLGNGNRLGGERLLSWRLPSVRYVYCVNFKEFGGLSMSQQGSQFRNKVDAHSGHLLARGPLLGQFLSLSLWQSRYLVNVSFCSCCLPVRVFSFVLSFPLITFHCQPGACLPSQSASFSLSLHIYVSLCLCIFSVSSFSRVVSRWMS